MCRTGAFGERRRFGYVTVAAPCNRSSQRLPAVSESGVSPAFYHEPALAGAAWITLHDGNTYS